MCKEKIDVVAEHWDQLYAPSSSLAVVTTVDSDGNPNAAAYGACTRVSHAPVAISFTTGIGRDTYSNVLATGEFVVNVPAFDQAQLASLCITGTDFPSDVDELERAGLTTLPSIKVRPPRVGEYNRHFECVVLWTMQWRDRLTILGDVVAASCDPDVIDNDGNLRWDVAKPVSYCGGPYGLKFTPTFEQLEIEGEDVLSGLRPTPPAYAWQTR